MSFKSFCFAALLIFSITQSCKKEKELFQFTGVITGADLALCACCGGYFIEIDNSSYRFDDLPSTSDIDLATTNFPISVNLDWQNDRKCGDFQYIKVDRIEIKK